MSKAKIAIIAVAALALVLVPAVAWKIVQVGERAASEAAVVEDGQGQEQSQDAGDGSSSEEQDQGQTELSDDTAREVLAILSANVWGAEGSSATLRFEGGAATETKEGAADAKRSFQILAAKLETSTSNTSASTETRYVVAAKLDSENCILTLAQTHPASGAAQPWKIECAAFAYAPSYIRVDSAMEFSVSGMTEEVVELVGGTDGADKLEALIEGYASQFYPTASAAACDPQVTLDFDQQTALLRFQLNNTGKTTLKVLHPLGTDAFEIGK